MNRLDLIIENIEYSKLVTVQAHKDELLEEALAAARSLRELKPVVKVIAESGGVCFELLDKKLLVGTKLYALDEVTK